MRYAKPTVALAHVVPCEGFGGDGFVVDTVARNPGRIGHTRVTVKAGNDVSLQAVVRRVVQRRAAECKVLEQIPKEEPVTCGSQSHGFIEIGVLIVRGHVPHVQVLPCIQVAASDPHHSCNHTVVPRAHVLCR